MSGNIQDIARLITRLLLKGDMPQYTLPAAEADYTEADQLFKKVIGLADEGDINGAENELLMNMEEDDPDYRGGANPMSLNEARADWKKRNPESKEFKDNFIVTENLM